MKSNQINEYELEAYSMRNCEYNDGSIVIECNETIYEYMNGSCCYRNSVSDGRVYIDKKLSGTIEVNSDGTITWDNIEFSTEKKKPDTQSSNSSSADSFTATGVVHTDDGSSLNLRKEPNTNNNPIDSIEHGKKINIDLNKSVDGWYYVKCDALSGKEMTGYVSSEFVKLDE